MNYQHTVTHWNYKTGVTTQGIFKTKKEAEDFQATLPSASSYDAEPGTKVYGIFETHFDVEAARKRSIDWMEAAGGVTGRD